MHLTAGSCNVLSGGVLRKRKIRSSSRRRFEKNRRSDTIVLSPKPQTIAVNAENGRQTTRRLPGSAARQSPRFSEYARGTGRVARLSFHRVGSSDVIFRAPTLSFCEPFVHGALSSMLHAATSNTVFCRMHLRRCV